MHQTSKKEQKPPFLPLQHAPITLTGGNLYAVSSVPDCQTDRPITYLHTHDSAEFGICLEGNGVFMIGGRIFPFRGGDCAERGAHGQPLVLALSRHGPSAGLGAGAGRP